jgi:hypothetical protein
MSPEDQSNPFSAPPQSPQPPQPVAPQSPTPFPQQMPSSPTSAPVLPKKSNKGLILGLAIGGGVLLIGIIITVVLLLASGGGINSVKGLQEAVKNKDAINCVATEGENQVTIQSTKGWSKVKISANVSGSETNILALDGKTQYVWNDSVAAKQSYNKDMIDSFVNAFSTGGEGSNTKVKCSSPNDADFSIPNKDWTDLSGDDSDDDLSDTDSSSNDSSKSDSSSDNSSTNSNGTADSIDATISDPDLGNKYQATKVAVNAFSVPQSFIDTHAAFNGKILVAIYVTASRAESKYSFSAAVDDVTFRDASDNILQKVSTVGDIPAMAKDAGYPVDTSYKSVSAGGAPVSNWVIILAKPGTTKSDIYMQYKRSAWQATDGTTFPAQTFKVKLVQ